MRVCVWVCVRVRGRHACVSARARPCLFFSMAAVAQASGTLEQAIPGQAVGG